MPLPAELEPTEGSTPVYWEELVSSEEALRRNLSNRTPADDEEWRRERPCGEPFVWID